MKRQHFSKIIALAVAALLPSAALAVLTESSTTGFGDGADAFTQGSFATTNFGASGVLTTRNQTGNAANNYKVYLRFDLSGMTLDRSQASAVTLSFASITARTGVGFSLFALPDGMPGDLAGGWTESTIHYNNAPANAASTTDLGFVLSPAAGTNPATPPSRSAR